MDLSFKASMVFRGTQRNPVLKNQKSKKKKKIIIIIIIKIMWSVIFNSPSAECVHVSCLP